MIGKRVMRAVLKVFALSLPTALFGARPAVSATSTASFGVTVTVQASCLASATSILSGNYVAALRNAESAVSVTCTNSTAYTVSVREPSTPARMVANRKMTVGGAGLTGYGLVSNAAGILNSGQAVRADTLGNAASPRRFVAADTLTDTITVTIAY